MSEQYVVTGPLAIATTQEGNQVYVYEAHYLPENVSPEEAERLVETGLVTKASDVEKGQREEARRVHAEQTSEAPAKPQAKRG